MTGINIERVLMDPASSSWIKDALRTALMRDPIDAAADAEVLFELLVARANELLASNAFQHSSSCSRN